MKHALILSAVLAFAPAVALAHGDSQHQNSAAKSTAQPMVETDFGRTGDPKKATRTISVDMKDEMHFIPSEIVVRQGETVKFVVKNSGKLMHELVIGTMKELKEHAELMKKFPNMEHDEPYMAHVQAGKTGEIAWQFTKAGEFHFACLVSGHLEAGMVGRIKVVSK